MIKKLKQHGVPAKNAKRRAKFKQALEETNRKYGRALKRLTN